MKPYYRKKGKYMDGRAKIVIEKQIGKKQMSRSLPKPEIMLKIMDGDGWKKILKEILEENKTVNLVQ